MPVLSSPKQERFCLLIARGRSITDAYRGAGYATTSPSWRNNAYRMRAVVSIQGRIEELAERVEAEQRRATEVAAQRMALSKEALGRELLPLATSNLADYMGRDESGQIEFRFDLSRTTYEQMKAIKSIQIEHVIRGSGATERTVEKVRIQLHEKTPAHLALARMFGWITDPAREPPPTPYEQRLRQMTPEQRAEEGRKLLDLARQRLLEDRLQNGEPITTLEPDGQGGFGSPE